MSNSLKEKVSAALLAGTMIMAPMAASAEDGVKVAKTNKGKGEIVLPMMDKEQRTSDDRTYQDVSEAELQQWGFIGQVIMAARKEQYVNPEIYNKPITMGQFLEAIDTPTSGNLAGLKRVSVGIVLDKNWALQAKMPEEVMKVKQLIAQILSEKEMVWNEKHTLVHPTNLAKTTGAYVSNIYVIKYDPELAKTDPRMRAGAVLPAIQGLGVSGYNSENKTFIAKYGTPSNIYTDYPLMINMRQMMSWDFTIGGHLPKGHPLQEMSKKKIGVKPVSHGSVQPADNVKVGRASSGKGGDTSSAGGHGGSDTSIQGPDFG